MKEILYQNYMNKANIGIDLRTYVTVFPRFTLYGILGSNLQLPSFLESYFKKFPFNSVDELDILDRENQFFIVNSILLINNYQPELLPRGMESDKIIPYINRKELYKQRGSLIKEVFELLGRGEYKSIKKFDYLVEKIKQKESAVTLDELLFLLALQVVLKKYGEKITFSREFCDMQYRYLLDEGNLNEFIMLSLLDSESQIHLLKSIRPDIIDDLSFDSYFILLTLLYRGDHDA